MISLRALAPLCLSLLATACAQSSEFPSLAKRPIESGQVAAAPAPPPAPVPPLVPSDPALLARIANALDQAKGGQAVFADGLKAATGATEAAAGSAKGGDSWINAQLQISRAERALAPAAEALARLDQDLTALIASQPASPDRPTLESAVAEVERIANDQRTALLDLVDRLKR